MKYENPMEVKRSLEAAGVKVVEKLKELAKECKSDKEILQVATISAESTDIGNMIADTLKTIGKDGVINVEQSQLRDTEAKVVEGYEIEKGYVHPFMANTKNNTAEYNNANVLVFGEKLSSIVEIYPFLNGLVEKGINELVIFCPEIDPAVLNTFALNKAKAIMSVLVVKANTQNQEILHDVAIVTGAAYISKETGHKFDTLTPEMLGKAERVVATAHKTTIYKGKGDPKPEIEKLRNELPSITNDNDYDLLEKRIARLQNGIAVISVGGRTEEAMQYAFYKIEDAVNATKAAIEEGIVEGGGMALYRISQQLGDTIGEKILAKALRLPLKKIIENGAGETIPRCS